VTLNFDLLTTKLEAFILVPKCTNAKRSANIRPVLFEILCWHRSRRMKGRTNKQPGNIMPSVWRHKNNIYDYRNSPWVLAVRRHMATVNWNYSK